MRDFIEYGLKAEAVEPLLRADEVLLPTGGSGGYKRFTAVNDEDFVHAVPRLREAVRRENRRRKLSQRWSA